MANIGKWNTPGTIITPISSTLNSLANATMAGSSTAIVNGTNLDMYADVEIFLNTLSPTAGAYVGLYILESIDGTNFPAQVDADLRLTGTQVLAIIPVGITSSATQLVVARNIVLPPTSFQLKLDNQTGVTLATSGNTVRLLPYDTNLNG